MEVLIYFALILLSLFFYWLYRKTTEWASIAACWMLIGLLIIMASAIWIEGLTTTYAVTKTPSSSITFYAQNCTNAGNYSCVNSQNTTYAYSQGSQVTIIKQDAQTVGIGVIESLLAIYLAIMQMLAWWNSRKAE